MNLVFEIIWNFVIHSSKFWVGFGIHSDILRKTDLENDQCRKDENRLNL